MREQRYILRDKNIRGRLVDFILAAPVDGSLECEVRPHRPGHSDAQRRLAWVLLGQVAQYVGDENGELHDAIFWNHKLKLDFGFVADVIPMKIDGRVVDIPVPKSLGDSASGKWRMSKQNVCDYITQIQAFMAGQGIIPEEM